VTPALIGLAHSSPKLATSLALLEARGGRPREKKEEKKQKQKKKNRLRRCFLGEEAVGLMANGTDMWAFW